MTVSKRVIDPSGSVVLLTACSAGLYVAAFYTMNNLTMLRAGGILFLFGLMIVPLAIAVILVYALLHLGGRAGLKGWAVALMISTFLLFMLRPSLLDFELVDRYFRVFTPERSVVANTLFILLPSLLLAFVFRRRLKEYAAILGVMTLAALAMGGGKVSREPGANADRLGATLGQVTLAEKPNIYFILADAYASLAYMREHAIDVSGFTDFLSENGFSLYDDTYSNYQPTTSALPAMLNMEHHYYRLTGHNVEFSEVDKASRRIIGGDNNVSNILRRNGYSIQYIHNGTYLLLQGCSADSCFPEIDGLAGARIILSHIFRQDLLSDEDKSWETTTVEAMSARISSLLNEAGNEPRFQYIHAFKPGHPPNAKGRCDESVELGRYADRVQMANHFLNEQIRQIVERDPAAVIVLAGDHGPFISNGCASNAYIDNAADYRDRAGALMAIRWPRSYDGRYDGRISTGVNLFRYVLASLAESPLPLVETAAADDVFVRGGRKIFKVVEQGEPLARPQPAGER